MTIIKTPEPKEETHYCVQVHKGSIHDANAFRCEITGNYCVGVELTHVQANRSELDSPGEYDPSVAQRCPGYDLTNPYANVVKRLRLMNQRDELTGRIAELSYEVHELGGDVEVELDDDRPDTPYDAKIPSDDCRTGFPGPGKDDYPF